MTKTTPITSRPTQSEKFKNAAREAECDEDEVRWTDRLKKMVKPEPEKPA